MSEIVILAASRTPIANFSRAFKALPAYALAAPTLKKTIQQAQIDIEAIDEVILGNVLMAGQGQAPARQAALLAGLPDTVPCTTINKMCGSGMKAVMIAHDEIKAGSFQAILAGGMESMTQAPYLLPKAREGYRFGHAKLLDHLLLDGLEDAYHPGKPMGCFAEQTAEQLGFSREAMDHFAIESSKRAQKAQEQGWFQEEIVPIGDCIEDENPKRIKLERIPQLSPVFSKDGHITAASSSSISDGAASLLLMNSTIAAEQRLTPIARLVAHSSHAQAPDTFTTAPIQAIQHVLDQANWRIDDVDLFEINEAFAVVTLAVMDALNLQPAKVNIHGGACALGHPIGASGARIIVTLIHALKRTKARRGVAAVCIGGGEATAVAIELL